MTYYCSLAEARAAINTQKTSVTDDAALLGMVWDASRRVDLEMGSDVPYFAPFRETREFMVEPGRINSQTRTFRLDGALIELISATLGGSALTLTTSVVTYPPGVSPASHLRLKSSGARCSWYDRGSLADGEPLTVAVTGIWGRARRMGAWKTVTTLGANATNSAGTLTVANSGQLSPGHLIRIVTDDMPEYMTVLTTATGSITVDRAQNGTTAAAHTSGTDVEVWQVDDPIRRAVARQAGLMLARRGAYDIRSANELGTDVVYPADLLHELRAVLQGYVNR